ncbi:2865_t:CDS:2, partial [Cetraspora pellucida]
FYIFVNINGVNTFTPPPRAEQAAILIDNKVYFNGGWNGIFASDFFYLDISKPFTTDNIVWIDLSSIEGRINRTASTACIGANKNQIIYFSGGAVAVGENFTSIFDITTQKWSTPKTSRNFNAIERKFVQCITSGNSIYIYGGFDDLFSIVKLDTSDSNFVWSIYYAGMIAPLGLMGYSATLINNASILYIGGRLHFNSLVDLSYNSLDKLPMYNIDNNIWSLVVSYFLCSKVIPQFTLTFRNRSIQNEPPFFSFIALDTLKFTWSSPTISTGGSQYQLVRFTSLLIGAYVLIAFGIDHKSGNFTNEIFLLDVSLKDNYKWSTTFNPAKSLQSIPATTDISSTPTSNVLNDSSSVNFGAIIGGTFAGIAGLIIISAISVIMVKRYGHSPTFISQEETSHQ